MVKFKYHQYGQHTGIHPNKKDKLNMDVTQLSSTTVNMVKHRNTS